MHWGLTAFERKRIRAIALDHPYFDGRRPLLTKREMAAIVRQGSVKSGYQVIAEAMAELGLPCAPAEPRPRSFRQALRDVSFVPAFRRTMVLGALALLLVLFMTLTVPGQALAEEVQQVIVSFAKGALNFRNKAPAPSQGELDFSLVPPTADDPEELARITHFPILLSEDEQRSFMYDQLDPKFLTVITRYQTDEGKRYVIQQDFFGPDILWTSNVAAQDAAKIRSSIRFPGELTLYAGSSSAGGVFIKGYADAFTLTITSSNMTLDELKACMPRIYVWQEEDAQSTAEALDFSLIPPQIDSPEELARITHFPILLSEDETVSFRYSVMPSKATRVRTACQTQDGCQYTIKQVFYPPGTAWGTFINAEEAVRIGSSLRYDGEITLYAGLTVDGDAYIQGYTDTFILTLFSSEMTLDELKACMPRIYVWQEAPEA